MAYKDPKLAQFAKACAEFRQAPEAFGLDAFSDLVRWLADDISDEGLIELAKVIQEGAQ